MTRSALVTGGAGFIGSHLVAALLDRGWSTRVLDNFETGRRANLAGLERAEVIEGDLRDPAAVARAVDGVEVVFHQAALPSVPRSILDPRTSSEVNIEGTLNVLVAARDAGVRRVVYASSSSVYGGGDALPKREDAAPNPRSPYALTKWAGETYGRIFHEVYGFEVVALRYFNVFGPRQDPTSQYSAVIPTFITRLLNGEPPVIYGDGLQTRDFTFVDNVVQGNLLAADIGGIGGEVFNIACGTRTTLLELAALISEFVAVKAGTMPVHEPERAGDVRHSHADISKAQRLLGYSADTGLREGIERTVAWLRERSRCRSD